MGDSPHRTCTRAACQFEGFEESGGGTYIGYGDERVFFPGCPVKYVTEQEISSYLASYRWLKMGKTPMEMGIVPASEMDPRWFDAMELIDQELARIQEEALKNKP